MPGLPHSRCVVPGHKMASCRIDEDAVRSANPAERETDKPQQPTASEDKS